MFQILLGTNNRGKVIEISDVLRDLPVTIVTPDSLDIAGDPAETGTTFAENAREKAFYYFEKSGLPTLADDSGIEVDALKGELGLHTRRWGAGPVASDEEWIRYFLYRMKREENKRARFVCTLAFVVPKSVMVSLPARHSLGEDGSNHDSAPSRVALRQAQGDTLALFPNLHLFQGTCEGTITDELEAEYLPGLPISACFKPQGFNHVFSALTIDQKNAVSHRGRAAHKFAQFLHDLV